jgi:hypothetical protein
MVADWIKITVIFDPVFELKTQSEYSRSNTNGGPKAAVISLQSTTA